MPKVKAFWILRRFDSLNSILPASWPSAASAFCVSNRNTRRVFLMPSSFSIALAPSPSEIPASNPARAALSSPEMRRSSATSSATLARSSPTTLLQLIKRAAVSIAALTQLSIAVLPAICSLKWDTELRTVSSRPSALFISQSRPSATLWTAAKCTAWPSPGCKSGPTPFLIMPESAGSGGISGADGTCPTLPGASFTASPTCTESRLTSGIITGAFWICPTLTGGGGMAMPSFLLQPGIYPRKSRARSARPERVPPPTRRESRPMRFQARAAGLPPKRVRLLHQA